MTGLNIKSIKYVCCYSLVSSYSHISFRVLSCYLIAICLLTFILLIIILNFFCSYYNRIILALKNRDNANT